jgi:hypothetical protein
MLNGQLDAGTAIFHHQDRNGNRRSAQILETVTVGGGRSRSFPTR